VTPRQGRGSAIRFSPAASLSAARAALAKANYKVFLEKQKDRDKLCVEDNDGDLTMGVLDNTVRLNPSDSLKVEVFKGFSCNCVESEVTTISKGGGPSATNPC
jgi:hypothetical protein